MDKDDEGAQAAVAALLRATLDPYFASLLEAMKGANKSLEVIAERISAEGFLPREINVEGDLVTNKTSQTSVVKVGNVGRGAKVDIKQSVAWTQALAPLPDGEALVRQFEALLKKIAADDALDEDHRELARAKTEAVAEGLGAAEKSPEKLRLALKDGRSFFGAAATWVGAALTGILKSDAAQKTLGTVAEATTKAAIDGFIEHF